MKHVRINYLLNSTIYSTYWKENWQHGKPNLPHSALLIFYPLPIVEEFTAGVLDAAVLSLRYQYDFLVSSTHICSSVSVEFYGFSERKYNPRHPRIVRQYWGDIRDFTCAYHLVTELRKRYHLVLFFKGYDVCNDLTMWRKVIVVFFGLIVNEVELCWAKDLKNTKQGMIVSFFCVDRW